MNKYNFTTKSAQAALNIAMKSGVNIAYDETGQSMLYTGEYRKSPALRNFVEQCGSAEAAALQLREMDKCFDAKHIAWHVKSFKLFGINI
jgi:hypothetical protein